MKATTDGHRVAIRPSLGPDVGGYPERTAVPQSAFRAPKAGERPSCAIHPLSIGGKEDPVRLVFTAAPGQAGKAKDEQAVAKVADRIAAKQAERHQAPEGGVADALGGGEAGPLLAVGILAHALELDVVLRRVTLDERVVLRVPVVALGEPLGGDAWAVRADVTKPDDIARMVDEPYKRWGRLDVLFNNAGVIRVQPMLEVTEAEWDRVMDVNLRAGIMLTHALLPAMATVIGVVVQLMVDVPVPRPRADQPVQRGRPADRDGARAGSGPHRASGAGARRGR